MGAKRFTFDRGELEARGSAKAEGVTLASATIRVTIDPETGAIASLKSVRLAGDLGRPGSGMGLNDYFYVAGRDAKSPQRNGKPKIMGFDGGPLTATLRIRSDAPGCRFLSRVITVVDGLDRVDILDVLDRPQIRSPEGIHFGFAPNVPGGVMRLDIPWAVIRPEKDQLPGACKNYFSVGRWVDVSNDEFGVTVATPDTPLVEVGKITMDVLPIPFVPTNWIKTIEPSQTFYSYVMNNYWETNYKADNGRRRYSSTSSGRTGDSTQWPPLASESSAASRWWSSRSSPMPRR